MAQKKIEENGYKIGRNTNKLEEKVIEKIEALRHKVKKQVRTPHRICGTYRYWDVSIEELGLILEIDGEYWHRSTTRFEIDELKEQAAWAAGLKFIRVSDADGDFDVKMLDQSPDEMRAHNRRVMERRLLAIKRKENT